jgi:acetyltransferase-like isoleucine patch superfamily enzyme
MNRAISGVKSVLRLIAERLVRLPMHARLRPTLLRALGARIGSNARIDEVMFVNLPIGFRNLALGDYSYLGAGSIVDLSGRVEIGSHTAISPGCMLMTHSDPGSMLGSRLATLYPRRVTGIRIGDHTWLGCNVTVLDGVTIGDHVVVGAGAVVTKDVPSNVLTSGVPATLVRPLRTVPDGGQAH